MNIRLWLLPVCLALVLPSGACANKQVTVENSKEGKIAVYATHVVDATNNVSTAVKQLEAAGTLPTAQAAAVVKTAVQIDEVAIQLSNVLSTYDMLTPGPAREGTLAKVQDQLTRIGNLASVLLVPIADQQVRSQVATLVGALNESLIILSVELAKGVR